ncbi:hypothetical protein PN462_19260 [Spirulina sp. CS-785/01]|uniref:hypothetical protein n=1 Tax=Spirulina sp. CS-785/01 TaxID=3021716 RepID=UPI00232CD2DD|nr:hypothetical protein [Spirulina sp. CS-785/01]MDB9315262.1 hypothetical protein [Spirulina sp. CS-785/01]
MLEAATLAKEAVQITLKVVNGITDGALQDIGSQIVQYLQVNIGGIFQLEQAQQNPEQLEATILSYTASDEELRKELNNLVEQYKQLEEKMGNPKIFQYAPSGTNQHHEGPGDNVNVKNQFFRQ